MNKFKIIAVTEQSDNVVMKVTASSFSLAIAIFENNITNCGDYLLEITSIVKL